MLHYMHPQDNAASSVQRSQQQQQQTCAPTSVPRRKMDSPSSSAAETVSIKEHAELLSEYKKQDKYIHQLSYQNEVNKERASKYKQTLKARLEDLKALQTKVDKYKAQVKSLQTERNASSPSSKRKDASSTSATPESKSKLAAANKELAAANKELAAANKELASLKAELPQVKALLAKGGQATQNLEAEVKRSKDLQQQVAEWKAKSRTAEDQLRPLFLLRQSQPE